MPIGMKFSNISNASNESSNAAPNNRISLNIPKQRMTIVPSQIGVPSRLSLATFNSSPNNPKTRNTIINSSTKHMTSTAIQNKQNEINMGFNARMFMTKDLK